MNIQSASAQWNLPGAFGSDIDAAFMDATAGSMIFKKGEFTIYGGASQDIIPISAITNWPANWQGITAAASFDGQTILLFSGSSFLTLDINTKSITGGDIWAGLPPNWNNQIDAAVDWSPGLIYLFYGQEFITYDSNTQAYGPVTNLATWGLPAHWNNTIDAAINVQNGSIYFFRGSEYIIFDQQSGAFSLPTSINEGRTMVGNFPPPGANPSANQQAISLPAPGQSTVMQTSQPVQQASADPRMVRAGRATQGMEEEVAAPMVEEDPIRPTGPFPSEYRDDYKPFTMQLMNLTFAASTIASIRPLAAKNWIGTGVDILYVDPLQVNKSRRARMSAIELIDSDEIAGNQSEYIIPFGSKFESIGSSETIESTKTIETFGEFSSTFGGSIGGSVSVPGIASGSASASMSQMNSSSFGTEKVYTYKQASNELYKVTLNKTWIDNKTNQKYRLKLDKNFRRLIEQLKVPSSMPAITLPEKKGDKLPTALSSVKSAYSNIVKSFGTHLTQSVTFGGRFISLYELTRTNYENARMTKAGFETSVTAAIKAVEVGANAEFNYSSAGSEGQKSSNLSARTYITGGNANDYQKWNSNIETAPAPIKLDLMPISDLLTKEFFPDDKDIEKKAEILKAVMHEYVVNRMKLPAKVDLEGNNFFRDLKPLEYDYDVSIIHMKCIRVSGGEAGSANEYYGHVKFSCGNNTRTVLDIDEDDAWELTEQATRGYTMRDPFVVTLPEGKSATLKVSGSMWEDDDSSKDDVLGYDSASVDLKTVGNAGKILYLDFDEDGDKVEVAIKVTRKLKVESY